METLIIREKGEKLETVKTILKAIKVKFESQSVNDDASIYNEEFNEKMKKGEADIKAGKFKSIKTSDLWK